MEDKNLIKLLLLCSIIGIFLLFLLIETQDLKPIQLNKVQDYKDQVVKVQGEIEKITIKEKVAFIDIKDQTGNLVLVKFNPKNKEFEQLEQGNNITATGKVQFYQDKWEIILQELICTSC